MIHLSRANTSFLTANYLDVGDESLPRDAMTSNALSSPSGFLRLACFTARKTEQSTQVRAYSGAVAAGATPTLCRIGIYQMDSSNNGTLIAATANDTSLFAATSTPYTKSWSTPFTKLAGVRYGIGALVVTAAAAPQLPGCAVANSAESGVSPAIGLVFTGLADLPASLVGASAVANGIRPYMVVLP